MARWRAMANTKYRIDTDCPMDSRKDAFALQQTSQLLLRNLPFLEGEHIALINYACDPMLAVLQEHYPASKITGFTHDYATHCCGLQQDSSTKNEGVDLIYDATLPANLHCDIVIIYLPKSQLLTKLILQMAASVLSPGARLFLVGHNNAGIRSSRQLLEEIIGPTHKVDAARHCVLFEAIFQARDITFSIEDWGVTYPVAVGDKQLAISSYPGVFSHGKLDAGTALLLKTLDGSLGETMLEVGCGCGVLGAAIGLLSPTTQIDLIDTNALALLATRRTLAQNGLSSATIYPSNVFSDVQGTYDAIISNPPFHKGVQTDYQATVALLTQAARFLKKGGQLRIVANRFLKYASLIEEHIGTCQVIAENRQYSVYGATRTRN